MKLEQFFALLPKIRPLTSLKPISFAGWAAFHFRPEVPAHNRPKHGRLRLLLLALIMSIAESYTSFRFFGFTQPSLV
jgi:hypothetical protein